jgi:uncharacterized membrane protein
MTSYLAGIETIVGGNLGNALGDPTGTLAGILGLLFFIALWAYAGAGFEVGAILFSILVALFANFGFLPIWVLYIEGVILAIAIVMLFAVFHQH